MKKILSIILNLSLLFIPFLGQAKTYNFDYYNNQNNETILPAANPPLKEVEKEIEDPIFTLGYFLYNRARPDSDQEKPALNKSATQGLKFGYGKRGDYNRSCSNTFFLKRNVGQVFKEKGVGT